MCVCVCARALKNQVQGLNHASALPLNYIIHPIISILLKMWSKNIFHRIPVLWTLCNFAFIYGAHAINSLWMISKEFVFHNYWVHCFTQEIRSSSLIVWYNCSYSYWFSLQIGFIVTGTNRLSVLLVPKNCKLKILTVIIEKSIFPYNSDQFWFMSLEI